MRVAIATFAAEGPFLRARTRAVTAERRILGEWAPYTPALAKSGPGPGARGIRGATIIAGLAGAAGLFALTVWSADAYRFNQGGRPLFSWQTFLISPIEFGALTAAIGGIVVFFLRAGLTRLHHPGFDFPEVAEASQGAFVLALACDAGEDANRALALLASAGAAHSRLVEP